MNQNQISPEQVAQTTSQQSQQQQMQMEQQKNLLGNLNKLNEPIKQGSVMQELTNQLKGGFE